MRNQIKRPHKQFRPINSAIEHAGVYFIFFNDLFYLPLLTAVHIREPALSNFGP